MSQGIQKLTVGVDRGIVDRSIAIVPSTILQEDHLVGEEVQQATTGCGAGATTGCGAGATAGCGICCWKIGAAPPYIEFATVSWIGRVLADHACSDSKNFSSLPLPRIKRPTPSARKMRPPTMPRMSIQLVSPESSADSPDWVCSTGQDARGSSQARANCARLVDRGAISCCSSGHILSWKGFQFLNLYCEIVNVGQSTFHRSCRLGQEVLPRCPT